jgi:hypothetical protein
MADTDAAFSDRFPAVTSPPVSLSQFVRSGVDSEAAKAQDSKKEEVERNLHAVAERERAAIEGGIKDESRLSSQYNDVMKRMISAEGAVAGELKPWNTEKELAKHETTLWDAFGSPGFLIAMLGSAFSAQPMNSALMAGGAAMAALKKNDHDAYEKAFEAWKENSDLAIKRMNIEHQTFQDIAELRTRDFAEYQARMRETLAKFDNQRGLALMDAGYYPQVEEMISKIPVLREQAEEATHALKTRKLVQDALQSDPRWNSGDPKQMLAAQREIESGFTFGGTPAEQQVHAQEDVLPYTKAFGVASVLMWTGRKLQDFATGGDLSESVAMQTQAQQQLDTLRFRALNALSSGIQSEQRLKLVQERVGNLVPETGHAWTGPGEASLKLSVLKNDLDEQIRINREILTSPNYDAKEKQKASSRVMQQQSVRDGISHMLDIMSLDLPEGTKFDMQHNQFVRPDGYIVRLNPESKQWETNAPAE